MEDEGAYNKEKCLQIFRQRNSIAELSIALYRSTVRLAAACVSAIFRLPRKENLGVYLVEHPREQRNVAERCWHRAARRLKADLQYLRRRGLFKASGGGSGGGSELSHQGRKCARCGATFGRFYNTGATCTRCRHRVCRQCRIEIKSHAGGDKEVEWICNVCYKIAELHVITDKWMCETPDSGSVNEKTSPSPVDILNRSIRRAWTINGPPTRWSAARKSPELRIYRSLPSRHQDYRKPVEDDVALSKPEDSHEGSVDTKDCIENSGDNKDANKTIEKSTSSNERTKREKSISKSEEEVPSSDFVRISKRVERALGKEQEDSASEQSTPRVSLIKPPRILAKFISPETKASPTKHGERKSNIPIFKRSSKEFEDIRSPQESPKRSLIPQRYRGSTDDLRRSREDISVPSLIPKLLSSRGKEERLKRQDSKDDIRHSLKTARKDPKEESSKSSLLIASSTSASKDEISKSGIKIFRRDNSREDVGRDGSNSIKESAKGKQQERQEKTESVGGATKLRIAGEQNRAKCEDDEVQDDTNDAEDLSLSRSVEEDASVEQDDAILESRQEDEKVDAENRQDARMLDVIVAENRMQDERMQEQRTMVVGEEMIDAKYLLASREPVESVVENDKERDDNDKEETRDIAERLLDISSDGDVTGTVGERKGPLEIGYGKKPDEFQVIRRKFSKEEFSNPDDTDDTPNKRCSSHLSPEASPLSTRSSRYSPRESESEPTPALPRKIGGDSCSASQRIRDAITRTRRESNSSTRYESSGSESVRLSETGLHGYVELARKVKFLGGNGSGAISSAIGGDEVVQRDSATSAGEDEANEDGHDRTGPIPSQGRAMLRRRRQFDAQDALSLAAVAHANRSPRLLRLSVATEAAFTPRRETSRRNKFPRAARFPDFSGARSRRRGRSHARSCCGGEDLQSLQTLNLIGRGGGGGRQRSPNSAGGCQGQDQPASVVDYRRLVFISSDSSSGREEDDADSSCSSSSYLNGLPRNGGHHHHHHAQSLEDCDWDYFESGSLPLPSTPIAAANVIGTADAIGVNVGQDVWSCCPGRGSAACQACGGSRSANVLPVPVPIPVPVPYPVPVPAALWTGDFAAAASSMISRGDGHAEPGTLRLRGDPAAPWFAWHPRFNQPLHGARLDPRLAGTFDPTTCTFRPPEQVMTPRLYGPITESATNLESPQVGQDVRDDATVVLKTEELKKEENSPTKDIGELASAAAKSKARKLEDTKTIETRCEKDDEEAERVEVNEEVTCEDSLSSFERSAQGMYQRARENSGSSSGRSSADSSDLEEDSSSHRFSRVFVVNDDSLTSDNDIEDNEEDDSDSAAEGGVTLKRVTAISEEEPVVLQHVRLLNEDALVENRAELVEPKGRCNTHIVDGNHLEDGDKSLSEHVNNSNDKRKSRRKDNGDKRFPLLLQRRSIPEEIYLADDNDSSDNRVELKSIRTLDPDNIDLPVATLKLDEKSILQIETHPVEEAINTSGKILQDKLIEPKSLSSDTWDSNIVPDSLEISSEVSVLENNADDQVNEQVAPLIVTNDCEKQIDKKSHLSETDRSNNDVIVDSSTDSSTSNESNTTGSEVSSDELHEYEVTPVELSFDYSNEVIAINGKLPYQIGRKKTKDTSSDIKENGYHLHGCDNQSNPTMTKSGAKRNVQSERPISGQSSDNSMMIESLIGARDDDDGGDDGGDNDEDDDEGYRSVTCRRGGQDGGAKDNDLTAGEERVETDMGDASISSKIQEMLRSAEEQDGTGCKVDSAHDGPVRGEIAGQVGGNGDSSCGGGGGESIEKGSATRFRSVERRPCTRQENGFPADGQASAKDSAQPNSNNNNTSGSGNNKYRSLVMITQEAAYQPVSVVTSDTTTLLQPDEIHSTGSQGGLAGYFQLALEAASEPQLHRKNAPRKPLMVKRPSATVPAAATSHQSVELEADSGLSVGSASESDDVSVKNVPKPLNCRQENADDVSKDRTVSESYRETTRPRASSQSSDDNSGAGGVTILEEGLADDDSWVEEVSHDEDEPGATTATEESSEDEANNFGDREEELRGYRRQAIDFTLHTIVEESCEESETEPSLATGSPSKKPRPPSASELEKYFFFGLGGDGNNSSMGSREVDSLSETSSIYSEGLESLGQDEANGNGQNQDRSNTSDGFLNSSKLEKYYLSEFLGFDQDRRDSDGSVGSDSEGRPSPEAQRRKKLVRARGTGRSHSSSLDNLLALTQSSQNLSSQNSLQDLSLNQDAQETQSEGSSTETDGTEDGQTAAFGTDGQFDTVKRKKKKPRNLGTQSPRVPDDRNKTPEPSREIINLVSVNSNDGQRSKQQSRDSGFVGSCDDLLQHQKLPDDGQANNAEVDQEAGKDRSFNKITEHSQNATMSVAGEGTTNTEKNNLTKHPVNHTSLPHLANASLSRKDSFNNWSSDEETNLMMSKMRQFFKTMVANTNGQGPGQGQNATSTNSSGASPAPSPRLPGYTSKARLCAQNRTKPPQLVYFENELTRLMKTVPGIRDEQVREIVEYLSSEDTWSDSYDSSDYTSSDLEGAAGGRRSALQEQISQSCQQIISKFDTTAGSDVTLSDKERDQTKGSVAGSAMQTAPCLGRDTAFVYQKLVQSFTKMAGDGVSSDANSTPHSSPPLIAKVMHHIGSRLVALMHEVSEGGPAAQHHSTTWRRYSQHHRTPSSASTTEDDDSTSDSTNAPSSAHLQLPRSKSHDPLLLINNHPAASTGQEGEEREASDYERFSWRGSFESALMAADSRTKLSLLACSGDVSAGGSASASASALAAKRRSAGDLLFNPKSFSREQLDRVRSCGSIGGGSGGGTGGGGNGSGGSGGGGGSVEERIWSNRRRSSVPDANTKGESGASAGDEDTEDELEYGGESRATTLPRGMQSAISAATNSLPRLPANVPAGLTTTTSPSSATSSSPMHKAHSVYHFLPQHSGVKSARYRPPGFARNSNVVSGTIGSGPKRAVSAPGLQVSGSQAPSGKRENSRSRRQQAISLTSGARYSTFKESSIRDSWTTRKIAQYISSIWLLDCCCGSCYARQRTASTSRSNGANEANKKNISAVESQIPSNDSVKSKDDIELAMEDVLMKRDYEVTKDNVLSTTLDTSNDKNEEALLINHKDDSSLNSSDPKYRSSISTKTLSSRMKRMIVDLSVLPKKEKKSAVADEKKASENYSEETEHPTEIFTKCSKRYAQQTMFKIPKLIINDGSSLSEACSTPIIGAGSRAGSSHTVMDMDDMDPGHLATRSSLSSLGARSDSMASVYSGAGEGRCCRSVVVTGEVEFALQYDYKNLTFEVHVTKCKNLAPVDVKRKRSDPYVKVYLLPDKSKSGKRKTKVKKHTLNPEFNETLKFHMSLNGLETRTLWLTVWHSDMFGRNDFLGEVRMPLENKIFDDPTPHWYPLQERTEPFDDPVAYKGEVIVGLKFVPPDPAQQERDRENSVERSGSKTKKNWSRGALHVLVKEARNLQTRSKNSGTCDPFCKSYLLPDKGRSGKQKTSVVRRSDGSPIWGHTFIYKDVSLQELAERGLELTVWDHDRIASNEFLGGVRFNLGTGKHYGKPVDWMDATGRELSLWQNMLERPNFWVEGAVTLRPNLHNHGKNNGS
ncbi:Synaptotagmin-like protein [Ooceraea biroi]|uniref:Synaptotagmin-like protein n=1 Tax=Ooceraea biroi TaxID=2015173 RepID=A0A026VSV6_OOCBI|nr:Synaptotagmin-like protein [Ooceraea biroi]